MEREIEELRNLVGDLFTKLEALERRHDTLDGAVQAAHLKGPEPLLTCVQCLQDYKESENGDGYCKYHNGMMEYREAACCSTKQNKVPVEFSPNGKVTPLSGGCTKGKHRSKHHSDYFYINYLIYMYNLSNEAEKMWLEMDIYDHTSDTCLWAEVGYIDGSVFVLAGGFDYPRVFAILSSKELRNCKKPCTVLFKKEDKAGWCLKAELVVSGFTASSPRGITVSLQAACYEVPFSKKINFSTKDNEVELETVESLSDPRPGKVPASVTYTVPEPSRTGPVLEPGEDYSQKRKTDYPTETSPKDFPITMTQYGNIMTESTTSRFITRIKVVNGCKDSVSIVDVIGEYKNSGGQWIKCDEVLSWKDERGSKIKSNFLLDGNGYLPLFVKLAIEFQDNLPRDFHRAHHSLPQPLQLRVTLVDNINRTASLIFEQGNRPHPLATPEGRQARLSEGEPILFHLFADDADLFQRADVTLYYKKYTAKLAYHWAVYDKEQGLTILQHELDLLAYKAKKSGKKEQKFERLMGKTKEKVIEVSALVDLEHQFTFALKVEIATPTSSATGYLLLQRRDYSNASVTVTPEQIHPNEQFMVQWNISEPFKYDELELHKRFGKKCLSSKAIGQSDSISLKAPSSPGVYEVRYYPSHLQKGSTGLRHSFYVATTTINVTPI